MKFISRAQWGAQYPQGSGPIPGPVYGVTLHWEGPHMGDFPHGVCTRKVRTIERFHAVTRGWSGIAYNAVVCPHGYVFEGRGLFVRSAANGTSNIGGNDHWYAVCYLGGQGDPLTDDGKQGYADAIGWLREHGAAGPRVNGHRDHHSTECPGDEIYAWLNRADFTARTTAEEDPMPSPDDLWSYDQIPVIDGEKGQKQQAKWALAQARNRAGDARSAAREAVKGIEDLAKLIGDQTLTAQERAVLANEIAERTAKEVERLDAAEVAERLEVTPKEKK